MSKLKRSVETLTVLLPGATGFIGQHLQQHLLNAGYRVRALVRAGRSGHPPVDPRCEIVVASLTDRLAISRAASGVDAVVYCAGSVRGSRYEDFVPANVDGVQCLTEALCHREPHPPLLLISSLAASRPELSHYARSKRAGERVLEGRLDLCWSILRPPAVYGPGDVEMRPLLNLVRRGIAVRPGPVGQRLSLIHVSDLADAVLAWLSDPASCRHRTFCIDDGHPAGYDWSEIGMAVAGRRVRQVPVPGGLLRAAGALSGLLSRLLGRAPMLTAGKARELQQDRWLCDNSLFSALTGWRPRLGLEAGARTIFAETSGAGGR